MMNEHEFAQILSSCAPSNELYNEVYTRYKEYYQEFVDASNPKILIPECTNRYVELAMLYSAAWGSLALEIFTGDMGPIQLAYGSITSSIANDVLSIAYLSSSGMDAQACSLLRNLYELCILFLAITISEDLQSKFIIAVDFKDTDRHWYKNFRLKDMLKIIRGWEASQSIHLSDLLHEREDSLYKRLSGLVHNQYVPLFVFNFSKSENPNDKISPNVWGEPVTRVEPILEISNDLICYVNICFLSLLENKNSTLLTKLSLGERMKNNETGKKFNFFLRLSNLYYRSYFLQENATC